MKKYTPQQIVSKLRQADVELGKGMTVKEVCRKIEIAEQTYYRWRQKYGGMSPELIKELKVLQKDNQRLRKIIADQRIDMEILKEAIDISSKNFKPGWPAEDGDNSPRPAGIFRAADLSGDWTGQVFSAVSQQAVV